MGGQKSKENETPDETDKEMDQVRAKRKEQGFFLHFEFEGQDLWFLEVFNLLKEQKYEEFERVVKAKPNIINSITYENHFQPTLLIHALEYEKDDSIVEYLVKHESCDVTVPDQVGNTPFYLAAFSGNLDAVKWILERDRSVLNKKHAMRTVLHVCTDWLEVVAFLLQQDDIDVNAKNYHGLTPDQVQGVCKEAKEMIRKRREELKSVRQ